MTPQLGLALTSILPIGDTKQKTRGANVYNSTKATWRNGRSNIFGSETGECCRE